MLADVFFLRNLYIEIESTRNLAVKAAGIFKRFHLEAIHAVGRIFSLNRLIAKQLQQVVFVHGIDHIPGVVGIEPRAGAENGVEQILQPYSQNLARMGLPF